MRLITVLLAVSVLAGGGCAGPGAPGAAAITFYQRVAAGDGAGACSLLVPGAAEAVASEGGAPCAVAVLRGEVGAELASRAAGSVTRVTVAGVEAQVVTDTDVLFLEATGDGWLVGAAACDPRPGRPYDCAVEAS